MASSPFSICAQPPRSSRSTWAPMPIWVARKESVPSSLVLDSVSGHSLEISKLKPTSPMGVMLLVEMSAPKLGVSPNLNFQPSPISVSICEKASIWMKISPLPLGSTVLVTGTRVIIASAWGVAGGDERAEAGRFSQFELPAFADIGFDLREGFDLDEDFALAVGVHGFGEIF